MFELGNISDIISFVFNEFTSFMLQIEIFHLFLHSPNVHNNRSSSRLNQFSYMVVRPLLLKPLPAALQGTHHKKAGSVISDVGVPAGTSPTVPQHPPLPKIFLVVPYSFQ